MAGALRLTGENNTWAPAFLHKDHLGSVRAISGVGGAVEERTLYRPYGGQTELATAPLNDDKSWLGERYDAGAGLQYLNARYYDPELAIFYQPDWFDPTDPMVGTNRYAYGLGNPIGYRDPTGNRNDNEGDHGNVDETGGSGDSPVGGGGNASVGDSPVGGTNSGGDGDDDSGTSGDDERSTDPADIMAELYRYNPILGTLSQLMANPAVQKFGKGMGSLGRGLSRCVSYCTEGAAAAEKLIDIGKGHPDAALAAAKYAAEKAADNPEFVAGRVAAVVAVRAGVGLGTLVATKSPGAAAKIGTEVATAISAAATLGDLGYHANNAKQIGQTLSLKEAERILLLGD